MAHFFLFRFFRSLLSHAQFTEQFAGRGCGLMKYVHLQAIKEVTGDRYASELFLRVSNLTFVSKYRHPGLLASDDPCEDSSGVKPVGTHTEAYAAQPKLLSSDHCSDSFGLGTMARAGLPRPSMSSVRPFISSLNPRRHSPSPLPGSGIYFRQRVPQQ